ncbi:MAG: hypothetical protein ACOC5H_01520 [Desulfovermiculus sp.]
MIALLKIRAALWGMNGTLIDTKRLHYQVLGLTAPRSNTGKHGGEHAGEHR